MEKENSAAALNPTKYVIAQIIPVRIDLNPNSSASRKPIPRINKDIKVCIKKEIIAINLLKNP